jgi:hypothetical protein
MFNFKRRDSIMLFGGRPPSLLTLIWLSAHLCFLAFVTPLVQ